MEYAAKPNTAHMCKTNKMANMASRQGTDAVGLEVAKGTEDFERKYDMMPPLLLLEPSELTVVRPGNRG